MSDAPKDFAPWFIEFFALACAFGCVDSIREHSFYRQDVGFAVVSLILAIAGFNWSWIKTKTEWRPWNRSHKKGLQVSIATKPVQQTFVKPEHNVQFVGFKQLDEDHFRAATLTFRNVPNGKLLGKFLMPRLKVTYYDHATGLEIDDFYSIGWWGEEEIVDDISAAGRSAVLAAFFDKWRVGGEDDPLTSLVLHSDYRPLNRGRSIVLPFGEIRIVAMLFGNYVDSPAVTVTGILTLGSDGTTSFSKDI